MKKLIFAFATLLIFSCSKENVQSTLDQHSNTFNQKQFGEKNQNELKLIGYVSFDASKKISITKNVYITIEEYKEIKTTEFRPLQVVRAVDGNNYSKKALKIKDIDPIDDIPEPTPIFSNCLSIAQKEMHQALANSSCKKVLAYCCLQTESYAYCLVFTFTPNNGCAQDDYDIYD